MRKMTISQSRFGRVQRPLLLLATLTLMAVALAAPLAAQETTREAEVTFTKDVAPILQRSCVQCHRPGQVAPMSLLTYQDARPWARAIKQRVQSREMPPWNIDRRIGIQQFKNDPSLSDHEIATLGRWVDRGAPMGDPADMPPQREFADADAWQIGTPDLIVRYPTYTVPAAGPDLFGNLTADFNLQEDRYIKAIQTKPVGDRSRQVVHHALSYAIDPTGEGETMDAGQFLVEYASGKNAEVYPEDSGLLLQAGKRARLSYHLHSIGETVDAVVELGIVFHPKGTVPKHIRWSKQLAGANGRIPGIFDIPAGEVVRSDGYERLSHAARITMFQPHMHIRGKYQCLELIYPTQPVRTELINCAYFNYNWHLAYNYEDRVAPIVPAGTILHVISWHDNSEANRFNPDPKNWVGGGSRTIDEMGFAWIGWYDLTDEQYQQELAARKAQRATN